MSGVLVSVCPYVHMGTQILEWKLDINKGHVSSTFMPLRQHPLVTLKLIDLAKMAGWPVNLRDVCVCPCLCPVLGDRSTQTPMAFYTGAEDPDVDPCAYTTGILLMEHLSSPLILIFGF